MRMLLRVAAVAALVSCRGCGPTGTEPGAACTELNPVLGSLCGVLDRCPSFTAYPLAYRSRAECQNELCFALTCRAKADFSNGTLNLTVTQQTITVDAAQQKACSEWLDQAPCTALSGATPFAGANACAGVFGGIAGGNSDLKSLGADCSSGSCAKDLFCAPPRYDADAGLKTCQVCKALGRLGEPCGTVESPGCASGLFCAPGAGGTAASCVSLRADGQTCAGSYECVSGFCNSTTKVCDPGGHAGQACQKASDCRTGFCSANSTCSDFIGPGGACTANAECSYGYCDPNAHVCGHEVDAGCSYNSQNCASGYCNSSNHCEPRKPNAAGCQNNSECLSGYCDFFRSRTCTEHCYSDSECDAGLHCNQNSEQCQAPQADGAPCRENADCQSQNCNPQSDTCTTKSGVGGPCTGSLDCSFDAFCSNQVCQRRAGPDQTCTAGDTCLAPFVCIESKCTLMNLACRPGHVGEVCTYLRLCDETSSCDPTTIRCKARTAVGSSCSSDDTCLDSYCANSVCTKSLADGATCTAPNQCQRGSGCVAGTCVKNIPVQTCDPGDPPCPSGTFCNNREVCQRRLMAGESCSGRSGGCADGLYCNSSRVCAAPFGLDAGCSGYTDGECGAAAYCERGGSSYHCVASPAVGQTCDSQTGCQPKAFCNSGTCQAPLANGQSCSANQWCASGVCDPSVGCVAGAACLP